MGPGRQRWFARGRLEAAHPCRPPTERKENRRPCGIRKPSSLRAEVPELRTCVVHLCREGQRRRKDIPGSRRSCLREAQANHHRGNEPIPEACGFRQGFGASKTAGENSLFDAGRSIATNIYPFYRSPGQAAFFVSAVSGKPDSRGVRIRGLSDLDQGPSKIVKVCRLQVVGRG